jgi:hypothetical protein
MPVGTYVLCNLDEVKQYYGMTGASSGEDLLLEDLIDQFTEIFEVYCNRKFKSREFTEYHDGNGTRHLTPDQYPIITISGIWSSTNWDWDSDTLIDSDTYTIKNTRSIIMKSIIFPKWDNLNVKIIYTAGYSSIPEDLKLSCIEEVIRAYKNRKGVDVLAKTAPDGSITRYTKDLMPTTLRVLNSYKKLRVQ